MATKTRVIQKIIQKPTLMAGAIFAVVAIIFIQIIGMLADKIPFIGDLVNSGFNIVGPSFMLLLIAAVVIIPYWALDKSPGITFGEAALVASAITLATIFLVFVAPKLMPEFFPKVYTTSASALKLTMASMLGMG